MVVGKCLAQVFLSTESSSEQGNKLYLMCDVGVRIKWVTHLKLEFSVHGWVLTNGSYCL